MLVANIALPAGIQIDSVSLGLDHPHQAVFESIFTGRRQVLTRGSARWKGTVVFSLAGFGDAASAAQRAAVEGFLAALNGVGNTFDLPVGRAAGKFEQADAFVEVFNGNVDILYGGVHGTAQVLSPDVVMPADEIWTITATRTSGWPGRSSLPNTIVSDPSNTNDVLSHPPSVAGSAMGASIRVPPGRQFEIVVGRDASNVVLVGARRDTSDPMPIRITTWRRLPSLTVTEIPAAGETLSVRIAGVAATPLPVAGDYLRIGDRLYLAATGGVPRASDNSCVLSLLPTARPPAVGDVVAAVPTLRARAEKSEAVVGPADGDFIGPWRFDFVEAL